MAATQGHHIEGSRARCAEKLTPPPVHATHGTMKTAAPRVSSGLGEGSPGSSAAWALPLLLAAVALAQACGPVHGTGRGQASSGASRRLPPIELPRNVERPVLPLPPGAPEPGRFMPIEDPASSGLATFLSGLRALEGGAAQRSVRVSHYGDSHVAADLYTHVLRRQLQERFGDGGPGFALVGKPWRSYRHGSLELGEEGSWTAAKGRLGQDEPGTQPLGLGGFAMRAGQPSDRAWLRARAGDEPGAGFDVVDLHFLSSARGGTVELTVDGSPLASVATSGPGQAQPEFGARRLELGAPGRALGLRPRGDGEVNLLGVVLERSRPGVVYDTLGINGAQARTPLLWEPAVFGAALRRRDPDLVVLAYGANEAGLRRFSPRHYRRTVTKLVQRVREAAPRASCLLVAPCDRAQQDAAGEWRTMTTILDAVAVQRDVAAEQGCAFWNAFAAMGGRGSMQQWATWEPPMAQQDRVHLTRPGYRRLAHLLGSALLRAYDEAGGPSR